MKNNNKKYETMKKISFYFTFIYAIFLLVIFLTSDSLISMLYGNDFINSVISINILLIAIFFMGNATLYLQYIASNDFPIQVIYIWGTGFLVNIILNYILIKEYALYGVASSTVISYIIIYLLSIKELKKHGGGNINEKS